MGAGRKAASPHPGGESGEVLRLRSQQAPESELRVPAIGLRTETRLIFGPVAAAIFFVGVACLALLTPDYSHVQQSISAIGKLGSPLRLPFALVIASYACSLLVFASGIF